MPKSITLVKVFIASPSDVKEERMAAKEIVDEININYGNFNNVKLELVGWETHTFPNIGLYSQDVINKQIGEYDVFLGIMWNKFGSKTQNADSGTEEEFNIAYQRYVTKPKEIDLLFFFKDTAINLSSIDIEQLVKVNEFKKKLQNKNVYYRQFTEISEFKNSLRLGFTNIIQKYSTHESHVVNYSNSIFSDKIEPINEEIIVVNSEEVSEEIEELGFLESFQLANSSFSESFLSIEKITKYLTDLSTKTSTKTSQLNALNQRSTIYKANQTKKLFDQLAGYIIDFNARVKAEIPINSEHFGNAIKYYNIMLFTFPQLVREDKTIIPSITNLKETLIATSHSMIEMKQALINTPSMTTNYAKAKKEAVKTINELIVELQIQVNLTEQLEINVIALDNQRKD